jgi:hypothetical protein
MTRNLLWPGILLVGLGDIWQRGSASTLDVAALAAAFALLVTVGVDLWRRPG